MSVPQVTTTSSGQMSGIAALAAAAAATQKINTTAGATTTPVSGIKVVTPTVVSSSGVKVTPVTGRSSESVTLNLVMIFWGMTHVSVSLFSALWLWLRMLICVNGFPL